MRRPAGLAAAAAACALASSAAAQGGPREAALARLAERVPELFRVEPGADAGASRYGVEPAVPRLPVRLVVFGGDDARLDGRCALDAGVMTVAVADALAAASFAVARDEERGDAVELLVHAEAASSDGDRCVGLVRAEARLSRTLAEAGGAAYVFEPVILADAAVVEHRPRDFPTRAFEELVGRVVDGLGGALDMAP